MLGIHNVIDISDCLLNVLELLFEVLLNCMLNLVEDLDEALLDEISIFDSADVSDKLTYCTFDGLLSIDIVVLKVIEDFDQAIQLLRT